MGTLKFTHITDSPCAYFEDAALYEDRGEVRRWADGTWQRGGYDSYMADDQWETLEGSDVRRLEDEYQRLVKEGVVKDIDALADSREWIPVAARLPVIDPLGVSTTVIVAHTEYTAHGETTGRIAVSPASYIGADENGEFFKSMVNGRRLDARSWMPLPEPPEVR